MDDQRAPTLRDVVETAAAGNTEAEDLERMAAEALAADEQTLESRVYQREAIAHHRHLSELLAAVRGFLEFWNDVPPGREKAERMTAVMEDLEAEYQRIRKEPPLDPTPGDRRESEGLVNALAALLYRNGNTLTHDGEISRFFDAHPDLLAIARAAN